MPQCHLYQCKSQAFQKFKNLVMNLAAEFCLEFSPFKVWVINEEKTGIITLPNVLIKPWFMIGKMSLRKEMQWYKLTNPSAPWICMIIISESGRREDFHRRSRNCSSSMTGFCLFSTFFKLGYCSHLLLVRKAIRARLFFFHTASIGSQKKKTRHD